MSLGAALAGASVGAGAQKVPRLRCPHYGRPAIAADPRPGSLRVFAIQFEQQPASMITAASFRRAIDCVMQVEVAPRVARGRPNLRPFRIPGTRVRLGFATSLPAFVYGTAGRGHACDDVAVTYMRCLDLLGANVVIQADANDGQWTGPDGSDSAERWQPLSWMGSAWRAVSDPTVHFAYAVNPMLVGNLSDTPFDGQSSILQRGSRGPGCHYVGNSSFVTGEDDPALRDYAGAKSQFLTIAPWALPDASRTTLRSVGAALAAATGRYRYVQTALIADLPFPVNRHGRGCVFAGR